MADDDDTSAGLTPDSTTPPRRRASRSAGPPSEAPTPEAGGSPAATTVREPGGAAADPDGAASGGAASGGADPGSADPGSADPDGVETAGAEIAGAEIDGAEIDGAEGAATAANGEGHGRGRLGWIAAALLVVLLVASGAWLLIERGAAQDRDAQRNAFVQTARQTVLNLTTIKPETAKEDVERILAGASGEFKSEFDGREDPFVGVVKEAGVTTVGKILEAGFESQDGNVGKVLVAARADVSTPDGTQNGPRDFRMRVTVTDDGGTMTASKVEFVP